MKPTTDVNTSRCDDVCRSQHGRSKGPLLGPPNTKQPAQTSHNGVHLHNSRTGAGCPPEEKVVRREGEQLSLFELPRVHDPRALHDVCHGPGAFPDLAAGVHQAVEENRRNRKGERPRGNDTPFVFLELEVRGLHVLGQRRGVASRGG